MKSIYHSPPYQQIIYYEIKTPIDRAFKILAGGEANPLEKARAVYGLKQIIKVVKTKLPEPTHGNIGNTNHNAHILIDIRDRFFKKLRLPDRAELLRHIINLAIIIFVTNFYRPFIDWWGTEIKKSGWEPPGPLQPDPHFWDDTAE